MTDVVRDTREWYRWFAEHEAAGKSDLYSRFAAAVAEDTDVLELLSALPEEKRQPNLLFAATRHVCGSRPDWPAFRASLLSRWQDIKPVILARSTQTNEPARCATLLPLLGQLRQPLALIEVGASAGLCLMPDRYGYDYGGGRTVPPARPTRNAPTFRCRANAATPIPTKPVEVAWRAGLDLNPLDVRNTRQTAWLRTLVWPGQETRAQQLDAALTMAAADPPRVVRGDLTEGVAELAAQAPADATLVVFHTAVLFYVSGVEERERFGQHVQSLGAQWISNEGFGVLPSVAARLTSRGDWPGFVLALNGQPVAWTDGHGAWVDWL